MSTCTTKTVTAAAWTDLEAAEDTIVVQNDGRRAVRLHIGSSPPAASAEDAEGILLHANPKTHDGTGGDAQTLTLEGGDNVYARVISSHETTWSRVNIWQ